MALPSLVVELSMPSSLACPSIVPSLQSPLQTCCSSNYTVRKTSLIRSSFSPVSFGHFQRPLLVNGGSTCRRRRHIVRMAPDEEKMTRRSPLDFPIEWDRPKPGRRPDILPQFSPMKTPLPPPLPTDPPREDEEEEDEEEEEEKEEDPDKEGEPEEPKE